MNAIKSILATLLCTIAISAPAQELINTDEYNGPLITFGARTGFNISNMTDTDYGKEYSLDSWGTGFDAGIVADIRLRDFFSIQPGFFFQSRSSNFSYIFTPDQSGNYIRPYDPELNQYLNMYGHQRHTMFKIPILFSLKLHPAQQIVWNADIGPTFNFGLGGHRWYSDPDKNPGHEYRQNYYDTMNRFMMGLKFGIGTQMLDHYYFGLHYECGLRSARKNSFGGHDKAWTITFGYDF